MPKVTFAAFVAVAAVSLPGVATATSMPALTANPVAHSSCSSALIGGQRKCIARGQFCTKALQRDYLRYGLSCSNRDYNGRYHLR